MSGIKASLPETETIVGWLGLAGSRASHVHPRNNKTTRQRKKEHKTAELGFTYMAFQLAEGWNTPVVPWLTFNAKGMLPVN